MYLTYIFKTIFLFVDSLNNALRILVRKPFIILSYYNTNFIKRNNGNWKTIEVLVT